VIFLDENIFADQRELLQKRRISLRQIGVDLEKKGLGDDQIISLLHRVARPTLFTRDSDYFGHNLCHDGYCLVWLKVKPLQVASFAWRSLRHPRFRSWNSRLGKVIRVSPKGITVLEKNKRQSLAW